MKIITESSQSITVDISYLNKLSLFVRILGGVLIAFGVLSLITEGVNIISLILILVAVLFFPLMVAKGELEIRINELIEKKRIWFKTTGTVTDISQYDEIEVIFQLTYAANGGRPRRYFYLRLKKENSSRPQPLALEQLFNCYSKKDKMEFEKVIDFLSGENLRKVSYDENSAVWFNS